MEQRKTIIVTGASRGLGAATVRILAERGANVVLNARSNADLEAVAAEIERPEEQVLVVPGDVSRVEDCRRLVDTTVDHFGRLDGLVNNAGVLEPVAPLAEANPAAWRTNIEVNVLGPFYLTHFAIPHLRRQRGRVINISSGAAVKATEGWSAYSVAKAALNHFTRLLAAEEPKIVAIALRPGMVDTAMQATIREEGDEGMTAESHKKFMQYHEQGVLLPPEKPGRAVALLALYALPAWSGEFMAWDEARVQELQERVG